MRTRFFPLMSSAVLSLLSAAGVQAQEYGFDTQGLANWTFYSPGQTWTAPPGGLNVAAPPGTSPDRAWIQVFVPVPDAKIWFDGDATREEGAQRLFYTKPLPDNARYSYRVKASWKDARGQEVTREKTVSFSRGQLVPLSFAEANDAREPEPEMHTLVPRPKAIVRIIGDKFVPERMTIRVGDTVEWRNDSRKTHTVTDEPKRAARARDAALPARAQPFHSGDIQPEGTYRHTFKVPGTYRYFCAPHEKQGMVGEVVVEPADE